MGAVNSTMQELGSLAANFELPDVTQQNRLSGLAESQGKPLLVMFICNHCPYVVHLIDKLVEIANQAQRDGFAVYAISANDVQAYPQDSPQEMQEFAHHHKFAFPYLYDQSQQVAKSYGAACTPDFYIYDASHRLVYRGQFDASRPNNEQPITGQDLHAGLVAVKNDQVPPQPQTPSIGCSIKWRAGNQPDYF